MLNELIATEVINNSALSRWLTTAQEFKNFANEPIPVIEMMQTPLERNSWRIEEAEFVVVRDGLKPLIGRDLFEALGISITQTLCSDEGRMVNTITTQCPFKKGIANQFRQLISRTGRSKIKSKFHTNFKPKHQKCGRVQEPVNREYKELLEEEHIEKLNNCSDQYFISPIVITVKRDQRKKFSFGLYIS